MTILIKDIEGDLAWLASFNHLKKELIKKKLPHSIRIVSKVYTEFFNDEEKGDVTIDIIKLNENLKELDKAYGDYLYKKVLHQHGVKLDSNMTVGPYPIHKLAQGIISNTVREDLSADWDLNFYVKRKNEKKFSELNFVYENDEDLQYITNFIVGLGLNPVGIKLESLTPSERLHILLSADLKAVAPGKMDNEVSIIMAACYKGFDNMNQNPGIITKLDESELNGRKIKYVASQIFYKPESEFCEVLKRAGAGWKIRGDFNHSHLEFLKFQAKNKPQEAL